MSNLRLTLMCLALVTVPACAPGALSESEARAAMTARMERPGPREVKVLAIHEFTLTDCADAPEGEGVVCRVQMDVGFTADGAEYRDNATQQIRFVREAGEWVAYPLG